MGGKKIMKNILRKTWLIGIVILFVGASVLPSISAINEAADITLKQLQPQPLDIYWEDNFDSYENNQYLDGDPEDGGWHGWDGDPLAGAYVVDDESQSTPHSVELVESEDLVHEFSGCDSGQWTFSCYVFIESATMGTPYFIMLNTYSDGGSKHWSTEVQFNTDTDQVEAYNDEATLPLIYDEWVEIRNEIDLDADIQAFHYGGDLLIEKSWSAGVSGAGGLTEIQCVDLWSSGADWHYYDDFTLEGPDLAGADLDCSGELDFADVEPGSTVTGTIIVENVGEPDSLLDWEVLSFPEWGTWTFDPESGLDLLEGDSLTIDVEIVAPDEPEETFTGEVKIVNSEDPDDICIIDVALVTPVSQSVTFLELLAQRFPILAKILELLF